MSDASSRLASRLGPDANEDYLALLRVRGHAACADRVDNGEPAPPTQLEAGVPLTGGVDLTWKDASDDEDEFSIERSGPAGAFDEIATVPFDTASYHDATPTTGATYRNRVRARNADGDSDPSNAVMIAL
jgi:hypothetical protein